MSTKMLYSHSSDLYKVFDLHLHFTFPLIYLHRQSHDTPTRTYKNIYAVQFLFKFDILHMQILTENVPDLTGIMMNNS